MQFRELIGFDLGKRRVTYGANDAILYALSVGARPDQLDLVFERDLRVLPAYGCALGLWAVQAAGELGAYDRTLSLHAAQELVVYQPLPTNGDFEMTGRVCGVWDKGRATVVDIVAQCRFFCATYSIFLPGRGGWGGARGPSSPKPEGGRPSWNTSYTTWPNQAALYRLTGDLHPIHIDPEVSRNNGFEHPILHGLCTLGIAAREVAAAQNAHPCELTFLSARLAAPVLPGDTIAVSAIPGRDHLTFEATTRNATVLKNGRARFN